jgi:copper chaperone CopZ
MISYQNMQIVILRVSMHCHGCARKVEKHISKLEGNHILAVFFISYFNLTKKSDKKIEI